VSQTRRGYVSDADTIVLVGDRCLRHWEL